MARQTQWGIPYPEGPDPFVVHSDFQKLANAVDTDIQEVRNLLRFYLTWNVNRHARLSFSAGALPRKATITFTTPFLQAPYVFCQIPSQNSPHVQARVEWGSVTTSKATVQLIAIPGQPQTSLTGTFYCDVVAYGPTNLASINTPTGRATIQQVGVQYDNEEDQAMHAADALPAPTAT